jgi:hypothetical protein
LQAAGQLQLLATGYRLPAISCRQRCFTPACGTAAFGCVTAAQPRAAVLHRLGRLCYIAFNVPTPRRFI